MSDNPEQPGWYADADGAWWWWDGSAWTAAPGPAPGGPASYGVTGYGGAGYGPDRAKERTNALLMWILYLVVGGWIGALIFYVISKEKPFVRHHAAEALNLTLVLLVPQIVGYVFLVPWYLDYLDAIVDESLPTLDLTTGFFVGLGILGVTTLLNYGFGILGAVRANRGQWSRLPIGLHPVRGALEAGEQPPYDVGS